MSQRGDETTRTHRAMLADMPLDTILAYLRERGFVVGESWVWKGCDVLPPLADEDGDDPQTSH